MKQNHNFFSNLAFNIAESNVGKTNKNPSVGCVIVKNNSVISSGVTSINGRPHAEYNALSKNLNFKDAYMYVTLEPCTHYGITPPCTNLIKKKRVKKVYYCFEDPDIRTYKKAKIVLNNRIKKIKKIDDRNKDFYKSYFFNKKYKLPFIDAKIAISKDFSTISKKNKWITNSRSRKVSHLIRSKYDCIISTSASINKDNSLLNCRIKGLNNFKPDLVIIDRKLRLKKNLALYSLTKKRKTYLLTTSNNSKQTSFLKKRNIKIIKLNSLLTKDDFLNLFRKLFQLGKRRILIESGLIFLNQVLKMNFINNLYIFKSNTKLRSNGFNNSKKNLIKNLKILKQVNVNLNNDKLLKARIH
jgi:diaminohydroxyphosphoribosylaminopyrimidine deaminase/5-amino-6-(5-phosphoribosylamino)uracil reductase